MQLLVFLGAELPACDDEEDDNSNSFTMMMMAAGYKPIEASLINGLHVSEDCQNCTSQQSKVLSKTKLLNKLRKSESFVL